MKNFVGLLVLTLSVSSALGSDLPRTPEEQSLDRIPRLPVRHQNPAQPAMCLK